MKLHPIRISEALDKFASYIENAKELTPEERAKFAYRLDKINDEFEKVATDQGLRTKNGKWLLGDGDESRYMKNFNEAGALMSDEDEERYMGEFTNTTQREAPSVSERKEPPVRDAVKDFDYPSETWKNPHRDNSLPEGNIEYGLLDKKSSYSIPKRKLD